MSLINEFPWVNNGVYMELRFLNWGLLPIDLFVPSTGNRGRTSNLQNTKLKYKLAAFEVKNNCISFEFDFQKQKQSPGRHSSRKFLVLLMNFHCLIHQELLVLFSFSLSLSFLCGPWDTLGWAISTSETAKTLLPITFFQGSLPCWRVPSGPTSETRWRNSRLLSPPDTQP